MPKLYSLSKRHAQRCVTKRHPCLAHEDPFPTQNWTRMTDGPA